MRTHRVSQPKPRRGFTLLEVLLVLVILGVIMGLVVPQLMGRQEEANIRATRLMIGKVETALALFATEDNGRPPELLDDLLDPSAALGRPVDPYVKEYPKDAWGNNLNYTRERNASGTGWDTLLWSNGPDGVNNQGSGDDINNWDEN